MSDEMPNGSPPRRNDARPPTFLEFLERLVGGPVVGDTKRLAHFLTLVCVPPSTLLVGLGLVWGAIGSELPGWLLATGFGGTTIGTITTIGLGRRVVAAISYRKGRTEAMTQAENDSRQQAQPKPCDDRQRPPTPRASIEEVDKEIS